MTGAVAYTGILVKPGKYLQQWAYAAKCEVVAWVRSIRERDLTCLKTRRQLMTMEQDKLGFSKESQIQTFQMLTFQAPQVVRDQNFHPSLHLPEL